MKILALLATFATSGLILAPSSAVAELGLIRFGGQLDYVFTACSAA